MSRGEISHCLDCGEPFIIKQRRGKPRLRCDKCNIIIKNEISRKWHAAHRKEMAAYQKQWYRNMCQMELNLFKNN